MKCGKKVKSASCQAPSQDDYRSVYSDRTATSLKLNALVVYPVHIFVTELYGKIKKAPYRSQLHFFRVSAG